MHLGSHMSPTFGSSPKTSRTVVRRPPGRSGPEVLRVPGVERAEGRLSRKCADQLPLSKQVVTTGHVVLVFRGCGRSPAWFRSAERPFTRLSHGRHFFLTKNRQPRPGLSWVVRRLYIGRREGDPTVAYRKGGAATSAKGGHRVSHGALEGAPAGPAIETKAGASRGRGAGLLFARRITPARRVSSAHEGESSEQCRKTSARDLVCHRPSDACTLGGATRPVMGGTADVSEAATDPVIRPCENTTTADGRGRPGAMP